MRLTGTALLSRIEKCKQAPQLLPVWVCSSAVFCTIQRFVVTLTIILTPCLQTGKSRGKIVLFQEIRLLFEMLRRQDEMISDNRELVQDQNMCWVGSWEFSDQQVGRRIVKWIWLRRACEMLLLDIAAISTASTAWFLG